MELIFKFICCSAVFIGFYHLILQREKMFKFNRFYLIATLILSFTIPFMELGIEEFRTPDFNEILVRTSEIQQPEISVEKVKTTISPNQNLVVQPTETDNSFISNLSIYQIILVIGIFVSLILLIRFLVNLLKISNLIFRNERIKKSGFTMVKIKKDTSPFSFFNYLFVSKEEVENEEIRSEIFYHEFAHIRQKHSLDVIFIEFLMVFFWFNPFLFIYRKSIQTNHEFLADEEVLEHSFDTQQYQHLLLEKISAKNQTNLASSFNYLVTKKRLIMMTKKTSKMKTNALKFFSIPLLALVMLMFSEKVSAQVESGKGVSKELFREYKKQVRKATVKVKNQDGTKSKKVDASKLDKELMTKIYDQMSDEQKLKVTPIPNKTKSIRFDGDENLTLNLDDLNLDEISKLGIDAGNLGIEIAGDILADLDLSDLSDLEKLQNFDVEYFDSPEWEAKIADIEKSAAEIEAKVNSPEWKAKIAEIEKNAAEIEAKYNSPEWKAKLEEIERKAEEIEKYYNSPEWKAQIEKIEREAEKAGQEAEKNAKKKA